MKRDCFRDSAEWYPLVSAIPRFHAVAPIGPSEIPGFRHSASPTHEWRSRYPLSLWKRGKLPFPGALTFHLQRAAIRKPTLTRWDDSSSTSFADIGRP